MKSRDARGWPSLAKGGGLKTRSRRSSWVRIPSLAYEPRPKGAARFRERRPARAHESAGLGRRAERVFRRSTEPRAIVSKTTVSSRCVQMGSNHGSRSARSEFASEHNRLPSVRIPAIPSSLIPTARRIAYSSGRGTVSFSAVRQLCWGSQPSSSPAFAFEYAQSSPSIAQRSGTVPNPASIASTVG